MHKHDEREPPTDALLKQLFAGPPTSQAAWKAFLQRYSQLILKIIWQFETSHDAVMDRYVYVCQQLAERKFERLRKFDPARNAKFSTWLTVVVRNLCVEGHRAENGRRRYPKALRRLSDFDRKVFALYYWEGYSAEEMTHMLAASGDEEEVTEALKRIRSLALRPSKTWHRQAPQRVASFDEQRHAPRPAAADAASRHDWVEHLLATLPINQRVAVRLRFWGDLPGTAIARLMDIPQRRVYSLLKNALQRVRERAQETQTRKMSCG